MPNPDEAAKPQSFAKRVVGRVEPALQHNGFAITFLFTYVITNIVFAVNGAVIGYDLGKGETFVTFAILARASGAILNLNSLLIIFVAAKALMTKLRRTALNMIVPFDKAMPAMHVIIGNVLAVATVVHVAFQSANYGVFRLWVNQKERLGVFGYRSILVTGILLLLTIAAVRISSFPFVRRKKFEVFFLIHSFGFVAYFVLIMLHGVRDGTPMTYRYVGVPVLIYIIDRAYRFSREHGTKEDLTRDCFIQKGNDMVNVRMPRSFAYLAGQFCEIKIPCISGYEWHPFTIASSPHESEMLFFIKDNGDWTHKLFELAGNPNGETDRVRVCVKGPYGAPAQHVGQYEHVVLISGGVGATPFASITKYAHHWILNYTNRGNTAATSVSAAFTRNQSTHHNSVPGTPTGRRSMDNGARLSMDESRNFSNPSSRNFSNPSSRPLSRNMSRNMSRNLSLGGSLGGSRPGSRNLSRNMSRSGSRSGSQRFERLGSVDSIGVIIQEQRQQQPHGPTSPSSSPAPPGLTLDLPPPDRDRPAEPDRFFASSPLPHDYKMELGNPDAPIPERRSLTPAGSSTDGLLAGGRAEIVREYDSSKALFDDDEDNDEIATFKNTGPSVSGLETDIEFGELDLEVGGIELEDEILREQQSASNAYNMLGMSFGSAGLLRHFQQKENGPIRSSQIRASLHAMDHALEHAPLTDRVMFYLHTVTLNWMLIYIMITRFALVAVAGIVGILATNNRQFQFNIYNSVPFAIVDLVLACILLVPVACAIFTEIGARGVSPFFRDEIGNVFDAFLLLPLLVTSIILTSTISFRNIEVPHILPVTIYLIWPVTTLLLLWRTGRTIGSRISLAQYFKSTHAQTKSLDFIWVAKTQQEDHWLMDQLLPLAGSGIVRLHRFITRSGPTTEPWMLDYEKLPLKTTYKRPDWNEIFHNLVERSRSGTIVGVFFCGPDPMARAVQQAAMRAMAFSVENALQRGYVAKKQQSEVLLPMGEEDEGRNFSRHDSKRSGGTGGMLSRVGSKVGDLARTLSARKDVRPAVSPTPAGVKDHSAYGCNVRISVRIENFN